MIHTIISVICICGLAFGVIYNSGDAPWLMGCVIVAAILIPLCIFMAKSQREEEKEIVKEAIREYEQEKLCEK